MSFNPGRKTTDEAAYADKYQRQRGPGSYQYESPYPTQPTAFPMDSWIRPQTSGAPLSRRFQPVDVESDMRGIGRPSNRAPSEATTLAADTRVATGSAVGHGGHHLPGKNPVDVDVADGGTRWAGYLQGAVVGVVDHIDVPHLRTTHGRLTHPAMALKGVGLNRFDPVLLHNPAEKAFTPFDRVVSTRLVSKDQWRLPACSLHRLKLMSHTTGSDNISRPVYTHPKIPGDTSACVKQRAEAVARYTSKAADHVASPPCNKVPRAFLPMDRNGCYGGSTQSQMSRHYAQQIVTRDPVPSCG